MSKIDISDVASAVVRARERDTRAFLKKREKKVFSSRESRDVYEKRQVAEEGRLCYYLATATNLPATNLNAALFISSANASRP